MLEVPVTIWFLFLIIVGILLFLDITHIEGFTGSGSGTYMMPLTPVYIQDCATGSCISTGTDTDRLTYLQRLPVGGKLISSNGRYVLYY